MKLLNAFVLCDCSALALRALSPPLALMTAQETALSGAFRSAHQARPYSGQPPHEQT